MPTAKKIGVFDSGVGGLSVACAIKKNMPRLDIVLKEDKRHLPYGTKTNKQIYGYVRPIFQDFINEGCQVIVVACNTVTTNLITLLRQEFPVPMVGMEPMIKLAAQRSKTGVIAVCATPRTLSSLRYAWLKSQYAQNITVLEPDCSDWALLIENNSLQREKIAEKLTLLLSQNADEIVLGCTHYHWIEQQIKQLTEGRAEILQPMQPVISQLKRVLARLP